MLTRIMRRVLIGLTAVMLAGGGLAVIAVDDADAWRGRHYCVGCDDE